METENTFWNEISKKENIVDSVFEWRGMSDNKKIDIHDRRGRKLYQLDSAEG